MVLFQMICQVECQKICQLKCQKTCQMDSLLDMPGRFSDGMSCAIVGIARGTPFSLVFFLSEGPQSCLRVTESNLHNHGFSAIMARASNATPIGQQVLLLVVV